jgi:DNA-nicking Smr family endonuclease
MFGFFGFAVKFERRLELKMADPPRKKGKHPPRNPEPRERRPQFELEPDAEEIFLDYLETQFAPGRKDDATNPRRRAAPEKGSSFIEVDLHRRTIREALDIIDKMVDSVRPGRQRFRIITGKGQHSGPTGSRLAEEVHLYVVRKYGSRIAMITASPAETMVGKLPWRGHFDVEFKLLNP